MRSLFRSIHLWLTFLVGLFLLSASLSGTALVFKDEIDAWLRPDLREVVPKGQRASLTQVLDNARAANPSHALRLAMTPRTPEATYELWMLPPESGKVTDYLLVYVDPYTADILGERQAAASPMLLLHYWHAQLLFGGTLGKALVALGGLGLLALSLTGLVLWWPGRQKLRRALTIKRGQPWHRILYDLHRAAGFYLTPLLVVVALTGIALVYHDASEEAILQLTGSEAPPELPQIEASGQSPLPAEELLRRADRHFPEALTTRLRFPAGPEAPFVVRKRFASEQHPNGKSYVVLNPYTGVIESVRNAPDGPVGWKVVDLLYPLHKGDVLGRPLHLIAGIMVTVFGATGLIMWWKRTRRRERKRSVPHRSKQRTPTLPPVEV